MATITKISAIQKRPAKKRWLLISLGLAATSALSYFGFQYWKKHKQTSTSDETATIPPYSPGKKAPTKTTKTKAKHEAAAKPQVKPNAKINSTETAKQIHSAVTKKDFNKVLGLLKTIKSVTDYSSVNKSFQTNLLNGVKQTLVNGVLGTFKDEKQKVLIRAAFASMGLKYDGKKWSLSGIDTNTLVTTQPTKVWKDPKTSVPVPVNMVLGQEVTKRGTFTVFQNENQYFLVESKHVNYCKN
jgi:hypothetical protein